MIWSAFLFAPPLLKLYLLKIGVDERIKAFEISSGVDVRAALLDRAIVFGRLRWATQHFELDINRDALSVARFVSSKTWEVDYDGLIHAVLEGSSDSEVSLKGKMESLTDADPWLIAHGHDMVDILRSGLRQTLGQIPNSTGAEQISRVLRTAFSKQHLHVTLLGKNIRSWEANNPTYPILIE